jgi:hypothetical protein
MQNFSDQRKFLFFLCKLVETEKDNLKKEGKSGNINSEKLDLEREGKFTCSLFTHNNTLLTSII